MTTLHTDFPAITARQRETWGAGNFSVVASRIVAVGEVLCDAIPLRAAQRVLDIATGSGNTALAAARRGADVVGSDDVAALLQSARERAEFEQLAVEWVEADAQALPFPDAAFDVVLSTFGLMFAPDQARAAAEALRVCSPGGTLAFAAWTPDGFIGELFRATAAHVPPPAGVPSAMRWGSESTVRELLGSGVTEIRFTRRSTYFRERTPSAYVAFMRTYYGPTLRAFAALDDAGATALQNDLVALIEAHNRSGDTTMLVPAEYLEVIATRR